MVHTHNSAIKKNAFESVLMRWMKLEPIKQTEVSQKEKHQYSILMHILNMGTSNLKGEIRNLIPNSTFYFFLTGCFFSHLLRITDAISATPFLLLLLTFLLSDELVCH